MLIRLLSFTLVLALCACGASNEPAPESEPAERAEAEGLVFTELWSVSTEVDSPESAYIDPGTGDVFVSMMGGMSDAKDGNGRIARIGADGTVKSMSWVTGLNAPKGLRSRGGVLWTADLDELVSVDIASAKVARFKVEGAKGLNDVAIGADGTVYATDMPASRIYAFKDGKASVFAEGEQLEWANGLLVEEDSLVVGGWGKPKADFTTDVPGHLFRLNLATKAKTLLTADPIANIDGLENDGGGGYLISDWVAGKILAVSADGEVEELKAFKQGTADIGMDATQGLLVIPHMLENRIAAYSLE